MAKLEIYTSYNQLKPNSSKKVKLTIDELRRRKRAVQELAKEFSGTLRNR